MADMANNLFPPETPIPHPTSLGSAWIDYGPDAVAAKLKDVEKKKAVTLTTEDVAAQCMPRVMVHNEEDVGEAAASNGGVLYYFCHIHSKMSGKIQILNADGTPYTNSKPEVPLYSPSIITPVDNVAALRISDAGGTDGPRPWTG